MIGFFDDFSFMFLGSILGYVAGLIPGVGNLITMLIFYPLIMDASLFQMLLFYLALFSTAQFSGSIVATVFGMPGESSSLPAVIEGKKLFLKGKGNFAISNAALGSVLGSFVSVGIVLFLLPYALALVKQFYNTDIQVFILLFTTISVIFLMGNNRLQNIWVFGIGSFLALIGTHDVPFFVFLKDIIPYKLFPNLIEGLPLFPVIVSLYVFPVLLCTANQFKDYKSDKKYIDEDSIFTHLKEFLKNIKSSLRGSFIGAVFGMMPYLGAAFTSNFSYAIEKKIRKNQYHKDGDIKSLVAAETANNSTVLINLMPLLLIGIPISGSEALLLSLIEVNSHIVNYTTTIETDLFIRLVYYFVIINIIALILSWPAVRYVNLLKKLDMNLIFYLTAIVLVILVYYLGYREMNAFYNISVMFLLAPLGYILRKTEPLVLLVAFLLTGKIMSSLVTFFQIHYG